MLPSRDSVLWLFVDLSTLFPPVSSPGEDMTSARRASQVMDSKEGLSSCSLMDEQISLACNSSGTPGNWYRSFSPATRFSNANQLPSCIVSPSRTKVGWAESLISGVPDASRYRRYIRYQRKNGGPSGETPMTLFGSPRPKGRLPRFHALGKLRGFRVVGQFEMEDTGTHAVERESRPSLRCGNPWFTKDGYSETEIEASLMGGTDDLDTRRR